MKKRLISIVIILCLTVAPLSLGGCANGNGTSASADVESTSASAPVSSESDGQSSNETSTAKIELNHTYTTQFGNVNAITYPPFAFDYPDGWTITQEEVTLHSEFVTLTSDAGAAIQFSYIAQENSGGGSAVVMQQVEVSKVADAGFSPWYVQAADYTNMGPFMVATLKPIGTMDVQTDTEYTPVDGRVSYAVLPESFIGIHSGLRSDYIIDFAFWYSGNVALIASGDFSEQETQEVISILASFRDEDASPKATGGHTAASVDELWAILEGTWEFVEFTFDGAPKSHSEHTMKFCYVDDKPCMSREYRGKVSYISNDFFTILRLLMHPLTMYLRICEVVTGVRVQTGAAMSGLFGGVLI